MSVPEWLFVGAEVARFTPSRYADPGRVRRVKVEKIGKRDVVLSDGERFNVGRLSQRRGTWDPETLLLPVFDRRVVEAERGQRLALAAARTAERVNAWKQTLNPEEAREAVRIIEAALSDEGQL